MSFNFLDTVPVETGMSAIQIAVRYLLHKSGQRITDFKVGAIPGVKGLYRKILLELEPESKDGFLSVSKHQANEFISTLTDKAIELASRQMPTNPEFGKHLLEEMRNSSNVVN